MPRLIIGHITDTEAKIWVRGDGPYPNAFVQVSAPEGDLPEKKILLEERHFFTGSVEFTGLKPGTKHRCLVQYGRTPNTPPAQRVDFGHCSGEFRTFPKPGEASSVTFMLGSCNLHSLGSISDPDPAFERLSLVAAESNSDFMIHCGDQIYYDIPAWMKPPHPDEYRKKYLDAWQDSRATRKFLTMLPHYMILDDHEMVNDFANDMDARSYGATPTQIMLSSLKVYREFVHIRQPNTFGSQALYYSFAHGAFQFFVMDTRSERWATAGEGLDPDRPRMVSGTQMSHLKSWLDEHRDAVKFIVTSVPFVAEVDSDDKWSANSYRRQREEILSHLVSKRIGGVIFLTGDMHNSYHATMEVKSLTDDFTCTLHELMSSPINQVAKTGFDRYLSGQKVRVPRTNPRFEYTTRMSRARFFDEHSNAMLIKAEGTSVNWSIFRTKKKEAGPKGSFTV